MQGKPPNRPIPNGLVLFARDAPPRYRYRRLFYIALVLLGTLAVIWPLYPLMGGIRPLIFGLPLSLAWVIGWLVLLFSALLLLFRSDYR